MIKSFLNKVSPTPEKFLEALCEKEVNYELLEKMLSSEKFDINFLDKDGNSFLTLVTARGKTGVIDWLIEKKIDVSVKNILGKDALDLAIEKGNFYALKALQSTEKLDLNRLDKDNRTFLQNAVINGNKKVAQELIKLGTDINSVDQNQRNVLYDAIAFGDEDIINEILKLDELNVNQIDYIGSTVLHHKDVLENPALAKKLLEKGADPTITDINGNNFLQHCATVGSTESMDLFTFAIRSGNHINKKQENNNSLLMETMGVFYKIPASEEQRRANLLKMAEVLVLEGIDVDALNDDGENGLFDAVRNNQYEIVAFFLNQKVNPNQVNEKFETPLLLAVMQGVDALDIILLLLQYSANPNLRNNNGENILDILNELILYSRGFKTIEEKSLLSEDIKQKQYFRVLKDILSNSKHDLTKLNYKGYPHFFLPLLCGDYDLFLLYITNGFDINQNDLNEKNIYYTYVKYIFDKNSYNEEFKKYIIRMIYYKVNILQKDDMEKLIFSSILKEDTNMKLYEELLEVSYFPCESQDKTGRTIMHQAVFSKNLKAVQLIYEKNHEVVNVADNAGILPITYAALFGIYEIVEELLSHGNVHIRSRKKIDERVKPKFQSMLPKAKSLIEKPKNDDMLRKVKILVAQIATDFKVGK